MKITKQIPPSSPPGKSKSLKGEIPRIRIPERMARWAGASNTKGKVKKATGKGSIPQESSSSSWHTNDWGEWGEDDVVPRRPSKGAKGNREKGKQIEY